MVEHVLLTTALEETWPEGLDTPVLFLGEWCKLFSQEERWSAMNSKVLAYHADDREKLHQNFLYLQALYKKFISAVARRLNEIHNVDHSIRYWDILAGPWLVYFLQIIFDRWSTIQQVNRQNLDFETIILNYPVKKVVPQNMTNFNEYIVEDFSLDCFPQ